MGPALVFLVVFALVLQFIPPAPRPPMVRLPSRAPGSRCRDERGRFVKGNPYTRNPRDARGRFTRRTA